MFPWSPVLDQNFTLPGDAWYEGWKQGDWFFTNSTPSEYIKKGLFNRGLQYMTGVTTQEAAYMICKSLIYCLQEYNCYFKHFLEKGNIYNIILFLTLVSRLLFTNILLFFR